MAVIGCIISLRIWRAIDRCSEKAQKITAELINDSGESEEKKKEKLKNLELYAPYDEPARLFQFWKLRILFIWLYGAVAITFLGLALTVVFS